MSTGVTSGLRRPSTLPGGLRYKSMSLCLTGAMFGCYIFSKHPTTKSPYVCQYVTQKFALKTRKGENVCISVKS